MPEQRRGPESPSGKHGRDGLRWGHALLLVAVCVVVYFVGLSWRSFASSEGHRVVPGWELLDSAHAGGWWRISMFEQTYLRKPPGMPWAIAGMSSLLGQNEFAARSVSAVAATLSALAAWWFASRWFGGRSGIAAGLALATMPQLWAPGRSAEIEGLHNFGVLLAALAIVEVFVTAARRRTLHAPTTRANSVLDRTWIIGLGAAGVIIAALAKGPAGAPVIGGVLLGAAVMRWWSVRGLAGVGAIAVLAGAVLIPLSREVLAANSDPLAITQGTDDFLWSKGLWPVLALAPGALIAALPASLAMLFPWGRDATTEATSGGPVAEERLRISRLLGAAWLGSLLIMMVAGVSNPRYAMPAAGLLCPLASYVVSGAWGPGAWFTKTRRVWARRLMLGHPLVLPLALIIAGVAVSVASVQFKIGIDGREAGAKLAEHIDTAAAVGTRAPDAIELWADGLVEARPDVLLYARQAGAERGLRLRVVWKKHDMSESRLPPSGDVIVLRIDGEGAELSRYDRAIANGELIAMGDGEVGRYRFRVFRVR